MTRKRYDTQHFECPSQKSVVVAMDVMSREQINANRTHLRTVWHRRYHNPMSMRLALIIPRTSQVPIPAEKKLHISMALVSGCKSNRRGLLVALWRETRRALNGLETVELDGPTSLCQASSRCGNE